MPSALASGTAAPVSAVSFHQISAAQQETTEAYWTPARMASAKSADIVTTNAPDVQKVKAINAGPPGEVPGGLPSGATARPQLIAPEQGPQAFSYPYPYTSFNVPTGAYAKTPNEVNGKIFFTNNGTNYVCSGTSAPSSSGSSDENEVWTAGHCVSNTNLASPGVFDSSAEFIPAYNGSAKTIAKQEPFGVFTATNFETATNFLNHGDISVDEGAMHVNNNASGQTLGEAVGWAGFTWNYSSDEQFVAYGYPAAAPTKGTPWSRTSAPAPLPTPGRVAQANRLSASATQ